MFKFNSCKEAMMYCLKNQTFSFAHLYSNENTMHMHIHDCYEIYFSISGGRQFLIDHRFYEIASGDLFFINVSESHYLAQIDSEIHERIVIFVSPKYLDQISSTITDLSKCFKTEKDTSHKVMLSAQSQQKFIYLTHKLCTSNGLGSDLLDQAYFTELMVFLNQQCHAQINPNLESDVPLYHQQVDKILTYINNNLQNPLTLKELATQFFMSESYICRIFKNSTGTTINKYISAQRLSYAKSLLSQGYSVRESWVMCGYRDYSNFLKSFERAVGLSPKKYSKLVS